MNESKATRYQRLRRRAQVVSLAAAAGLLVCVALTPAAAWLADWAVSAAAQWPAPLQPALSLMLFVGVLALAAELVALPASLFIATRVTPAAQVRDALMGAVIALAVAAVIRTCMWVSGVWWWALSSVALAGVTLVLARLLGAGLRASGETRPLVKDALVSRLDALSRQACGHSVDVREWMLEPGSGSVALVTGVGRHGHVLLGTDMIRDWQDDEIAVVVAHELSHHAHHDLARKVALDGMLWALCLGIADLVVNSTALAALPMLAVVAGAVWIGVRPVRLAQSRAHERRADRFALALTGDAEAFGRALRRLGEQHLAEERPSRLTRWWFHRHPTVQERLDAARVGALSARQQ